MHERERLARLRHIPMRRCPTQPLACCCALRNVGFRVMREVATPRWQACSLVRRSRPAIDVSTTDPLSAKLTEVQITRVIDAVRELTSAGAARAVQVV